MTIYLNVSELLFDIRNKSHEECANIADVEARYRAEAGHHKDDELLRSMTEVTSRLAKLVRRYLNSFFQNGAENNVNIPEAYVYDLDFSPRRSAGKAQPLADLMHSYVVHYTLAKFYATVSQGDLSNVHSMLAQDAGNEIEALIYDKKPPML